MGLAELRNKPSTVLDSKRSAIPRRDGRVAEGARLESVYTARYPGFESLSLRHLPSKDIRIHLRSRYKPSKCSAFLLLSSSKVFVGANLA